MASSQIKLIITDLDGTFLNSSNKVSNRNAAAFRAAIDAGYTVCVATGRSRFSAQLIGAETLKQMNYLTLTPGIFMNGLCVYGKDGLLYESFFIKSHLKLLLEFLERENLRNNILLYEGNNIFCFDKNDNTMLTHFQYGESIPILLKEKNLESNFSKVIIVTANEDIEKIKEVIKKEYNNFFDCFHSLNKIFEIMPKGANKWTGAKHLLEHLGIKSSEVLFIGDSENDIELLKNVSWSFAVGNANENVKRVSKYVTVHHDKDAFAEVVEKFCNITI